MTGFMPHITYNGELKVDFDEEFQESVHPWRYNTLTNFTSEIYHTTFKPEYNVQIAIDRII